MTLPRGTKLPRFAAMLLAAEDGLQELKPANKSHYEQLSKEAKAAYPLDRLLLTLELKTGAADREDGARLACDRLDAMSDEQFAQRMDSGTSFRTVVLDVSEYACNVDPFRHWRNAGCASIKDIGRRQVQLRVHRQEQTRGTGQPRQVLPGEAISWLDRLRSASAGELRVPFK